jgi:hypothetical protein
MLLEYIELISLIFPGERIILRRRKESASKELGLRSRTTTLLKYGCSIE